ncbi:alpha/beta fold hydrolase [Legionella shakespearei]|uniref:Hydrolases or acyltransferases (Alpha/beta hydrolase superfamily) n=1 Tax=Legionella shakespearei DSM 23087 TaxID=1122169 RepID=A0A0W0YK81_9GAMM|nr:alpha/beta hydrolase [Legionella shakespearei]KTD57285.1 hydrolases or acyltransferases (alpha/beta hydrolase superfamily) [Legionella shakespearei DSM 23087]
MKFTDHGYRINPIVQSSGYTWIFLPGGPGLGSEYLIDFCKNLKLPGSILLLDFPRDGTNPQGTLDFKDWEKGLIALLQTVHNPVLVTHSFAGMFVLNIPEIEPHLSGLVMMNTTTKNSFFEHVAAMQEKHQLPDLVAPATVYHLNPSDETYREFWNTYKYYCFTAEEMREGEQMIPLFAFNSEAYDYTIHNFYANYQCKWQPSLIPAMTIASEHDFICPPQIFIQDKRFQSANIINKVIDAGHCPWILKQEEVQECFNEFIKTL